MMERKAPGKAHRKGLTLIQLMEMFPTEEAARKWFESVLWINGRCCGKCGSVRTTQATHKYMPYWCSDCRSYFSIRTGTAMANSKVPLHKWAIAIYPLPDQSQVYFFHEATSRLGRLSTYGMVHAAPHPRGMGRQ